MAFSKFNSKSAGAITVEFLIAAASTPIMFKIASACKSSALSVCFSLF
jgi:hypothetical protein